MARRSRQVMMVAAWTAAIAAGSAAWADAGGAGDTVLRLRGSDVEIAGLLKSFDGRHYVLEAHAFGVLSLDAERYECSGTGCASVAPLAVAADASVPTMDLVADGGASVERFAIRGSDTLGRELVPALIRDYARSFGGSMRQLVGANPREAHFEVMNGQGAIVSRIDLERSDEAAAFHALRRGSAAIALASRPMGTTELAAMASLAPDVAVANYENVVALDGLAVIVPPGSGAGTLPLDKVASIFAGGIEDWSELGLPRGRITLYIGQDRTSSADIFTELVLAPRKLAIAAAAHRLASDAEIADAVTRDQNAIGIASYGLLRNAKALPVSDACGLSWQPSEFSIKAEEYPLARRLFIYSGLGAQVPGAEGLVRFANSSAAQATIAASQFMDQSVVANAYSGERPRMDTWLKSGEPGRYERWLAQRLAPEIEDARRLSLTYRFATGSSTLDTKARQDIKRLIELLGSPELAGKTVLLLGFTDSVGRSQVNAALSQRRAAEVRAAVLAEARPGTLDPGRLVALGYGAAVPVACNDSDRGRNNNRRVEVWVRDRPPATQSAAGPVQPEKRLAARPAKRPLDVRQKRRR